MSFQRPIEKILRTLSLHLSDQTIVDANTLIYIGFKWQ